MGKADGLSRRSDWKVGVDKDNKNQVFIKDYWIRSLGEVVIEGPEVEIVEKIKKARGKDEEVIRIVEEMKKANVKEPREEEWRIKGDLVIKEGKIYVLRDTELRMKVIQLHHDVPAAKHGRRLSQTSFSLYLHNQWTNFHKLSCTGKPQMRAICICMGCTKVITND